MSKELLLGLFCFFIVNAFNVANCEVIELTEPQKATLHYSKQINKDVKNLVIQDEDTIKDIVDFQRRKDAQDLEYLWNKTVEGSNLIKFALKKLAIPEEQRRLHSSAMAKTISAIVSGAAFLPMLTGQNSLIQSASFSASRIVTSLINKSETPSETLMTDTELIELAGMIETLQTNLLNTYYNYKNSLIQLKDVRTRILLANKNYSEALKEDNKIEILVSSSLYDNLLIEEMQVKQKVWCNQLQLQRLAGVDAVKHLNLYQYALSNELVGSSGGAK